MAQVEPRWRRGLSELAASMGPLAPPSEREARTIDALLRSQRHDPARVVELVAFVESGVELGSFAVGALRWAAARALELTSPGRDRRRPARGRGWPGQGHVVPLPGRPLRDLRRRG